MLDRRGDSATATNSNAGLPPRGAEDAAAGPAGDPEHAAQAAALLEEFKAKSKAQGFELAVGSQSWRCRLLCRCHSLQAAWLLAMLMAKAQSQKVWLANSWLGEQVSSHVAPVVRTCVLLQGGW